jgi:hypothetical protein
MSEEDDKKLRYGEVFEPHQNDAAPGGPDLSLQMPPSVKGMTLGKALLGQLPYWGAKRTMDAYRRYIESGVEMVEAQKAFYSSSRQLAMEKERWKNRDTYREGIRQEAAAFLDGMLEQRNVAEASRIQSEMFLKAAKNEQAAEEVLEMIAENNRQTQLLESERKREEAERAAEDARGGQSASFRQKMRAMKSAEQNYAELMESKTEDIEKYGGEEKFPAYLVAMYSQLEADLGFGLET